jgi:hypothetical protein
VWAILKLFENHVRDTPERLQFDSLLRRPLPDCAIKCSIRAPASSTCPTTSGDEGRERRAESRNVVVSKVDGVGRIIDGEVDGASADSSVQIVDHDYSLSHEVGPLIILFLATSTSRMNRKEVAALRHCPGIDREVQINSTGRTLQDVYGCAPFHASCCKLAGD